MGRDGRIPSWNLPEGKNRSTSTRKPKQNTNIAVKTPKITAKSRYHNNPFNYTEMLEKRGRSFSPCVEVNRDELEASTCSKPAYCI
jgi:hypothetical protein